MTVRDLTPATLASGGVPRIDDAALDTGDDGDVAAPSPSGHDYSARHRAAGRSAPVEIGQRQRATRALDAAFGKGRIDIDSADQPAGDVAERLAYVGGEGWRRGAIGGLSFAALGSKLTQPPKSMSDLFPRSR